MKPTSLPQSITLGAPPHTPTNRTRLTEQIFQGVLCLPEAKPVRLPQGGYPDAPTPF